MARFYDLKKRLRLLNVERTRIRWDGSSLSNFQFDIKQFLKPYWKHHICYEEMPMVGTGLRMDIYNATRKIAIECDGGQHTKFNKFFHQGNRLNYLAQMRRDEVKHQWCENNRITLIRIFPDDLPLSKSFFRKLNIDI